MESIDREKFGAFVAARRKELGLTQQELADRLFLSNKAVSKWERGQSLPDITLLEPLADCLEVSVVELLRGERTAEAPLDAKEAEQLVERTLRLGTEREAKQRARRNGCWRIGWLVSLFLGSAGAAALTWRYSLEALLDNVLLVELLCLIFGLWAAFFAPERLPNYYDENKVTTVSQGPVRLNLGGVRIHNGNWPHILTALRLWTEVTPVVFPALYAVARAAVREGHWGTGWELGLTLTAVLGLFVPVIVAAIRHE